MMVQEHHLDEQGCRKAEQLCMSHKITAIFSPRADGSAREGVAILVKYEEFGLDRKSVSFKAAVDGKACTAQFLVNDRVEKVGCVYLPSTPAERLSTINSLKESDLFKSCTILAGDHNCVPDRALDTKRESNSIYPNLHAEVWESYLASLGLYDISRRKQGRAKGPFTCGLSKIASPKCYTRIDRFYVKHSVSRQYDCNTDQKFGVTAMRQVPDHTAITLTVLTTSAEDRGKDVKRINAKLMGEPEVRTQIRELHKEIYESHNTEVWGHSTVWTLFKERSKELLIKIQKQRVREAVGEMKVVERLLNSLANTTNRRLLKNYEINSRTHLRKRVAELKEVTKKKGKQGAYNSLQYEEKSTKEFFRSLKKNHETQWLDQLKKVPDWESPPDNGGSEFSSLQETDDIKEILHEATNYYSWLYQKKDSNPEVADEFCKLLEEKTLKKDTADNMEGKISIKEIKRSMATLATGKSAGPDALPNEFYKWLSKFLAPTLQEVFNESYTNRKLGSSLKEGNVSLLYKKKERKDIRNYRPLTLLNSDYKILTRILCWRMKGGMHEIVSAENTGFSPGRFIAENTVCTKLMQAYLDEEDLPGALVFLDMEKAFDRVSWEFMHKALESLGFGPEFRSWIKILYDENNPQKRNLIINGHKSNTFNLGSGVAQGCPLSPLLFLCVAEALTRAIKADKSIKGITVRGVEIKINQFADDTGLFLQDLKRSWTNTKKLLRKYEKASGQKVNITKTDGVLCGSLRSSTMRLPKDINICKEGEYIIALGVPIGNNFDEDAFWRNLYLKSKSCMANWHALFRDSVRGRTLISQAMIMVRPLKENGLPRVWMHLVGIF